MTHEQPCPPAGVRGGAAGDGVSDLGTCYASDAVLAAVVSRPGQYQSVTRGDGNGLDASGVHWHNELRHLASAARGLSLVDGGTDHPSGDDQFVADSDVRVDIDGGVYDQSWRGKNIGFVDASNGAPNFAGQSTLVLDYSSLATTATLPFRVLGVAGLPGGPQDPANTYPWIIVKMNTAEVLNPTGI